MLRRAWTGLRWYVTELMGDAAYGHYLERHAQAHATITQGTGTDGQLATTNDAGGAPLPSTCGTGNRTTTDDAGYHPPLTRRQFYRARADAVGPVGCC